MLPHEALTDLATSDDPDRAASDVLRALDGYLDALVPTPRERPATDPDGREQREARTLTWVVVGGAVVATGIVAVALSGGWPAGLAIAAIWGLALAVLVST